MAGLRVPLSTLRQKPRDRYRMTRGRDGWLGLSRTTLSFATPCRSPDALRARRITSLTSRLSSEDSPDPLECRRVPARTPPRLLPCPDAPAVGRAPATLRRLRRHRRRLLPVRGRLLSRLLLLEKQAPSPRTRPWRRTAPSV